MAVRPEKLWFARHKGALPEADINRISAVVLDVTLIGEMYRYLLETEFGALLTLKQQHKTGWFSANGAAADVRRALRNQNLFLAVINDAPPDGQFATAETRN